jgi:hypothetical protein
MMDPELKDKLTSGYPASAETLAGLFALLFARLDHIEKLIKEIAAR